MVKIQVNSQGKAYYTSAGKVLLAPESGGEQVEAVNNTGSAITSGDKVWINQENGENKLVNYYKNGIGFSNFDVYGQLTFDSEEKVVSNFSSSKYIKLKDPFNPGSDTWEIVFKIKTSSDVTTNQAIFGNYGASFQNSPQITINESHFSIYIPTNPISSSFLINKIGTYTIMPNTLYWLKLFFNGTSYGLDYSLDGLLFISDITESSSVAIGVANEGFCIGYNYYSSSSTQYFQGSIDLSESYIKVNNEIWWQPYEQGIQKQLSRDILIKNPSYSDYFIDNSGIYKSFIVSSKSAHPYFNKVFNPGNSSWKLITKVKTPSSDQIDNYNILFVGQNDFYNTGFEISLGDTHRLQFGVGNGSEWTIAYKFGTKVFDANTIYWLKFEFNGSRYSLSYSLDGENYIEDCYADSTTAIGNSGNALISIGCRDSTRYWRGEIDLSETNIEVDGKLWNAASQILTNVTPDTQTGTAAENIAIGATGLVNVASGVF